MTKKKTDCKLCRYNVHAGFWSREHCVVTNPAEELTHWYILFINARGCLSYEPWETGVPG